MLLKELLELNEARGEYSSFKSWKAAIKKKHPESWIEGDEDIAQAMVGPKPYKHGETKAVGEWDGAKGELFEAFTPIKNSRALGKQLHSQETKEYEHVLKQHGFKKQKNGSYFKDTGLGVIKIDGQGHWQHLDVGSTDATKDFEGTTASSLGRHLSSTGA